MNGKQIALSGRKTHIFLRGMILRIVALKSTMITGETVRQKCIDGISATQVKCVVEGAGCEGGAKVELTVVSEEFAGKPLLKRHRMVNALFAEEIRNNQIHAISIKAYTPDQYESNR
jgi:BolA protein